MRQHDIESVSCCDVSHPVAMAKVPKGKTVFMCHGPLFVFGASKLGATWGRWAEKQKQQQPQQGPAQALAAEAACQPGMLTWAALAMSLSCADSGPWATPWPHRCCSSLAAAHTTWWARCLASALSGTQALIRICVARREPASYRRHPWPAAGNQQCKTYVHKVRQMPTRHGRVRLPTELCTGSSGNPAGAREYHRGDAIIGQRSNARSGR